MPFSVRPNHRLSVPLHGQVSSRGGVAMIRRLLIAFTVIALGMGYQEIALAIVCPPQPEQTGKDWEGEVNAAIARIGPVSGGEVKTKQRLSLRTYWGSYLMLGKFT